MSTSLWPLYTWVMLTCIHFAFSSFNISNQSFEALYSRNYFYAGGNYVEDSTGMHYFKNQMYVENLVPQGGVRRKDPIVFIHGQAQTGTNWLNTPDGRRGWASWFLEQGYNVYIVDQPQRGRSAYMPGDGALATYSAEYISKLFTGVQYANLWPQSQLHTQWPGTGERGDPIYDQFYASQVQFQNDTKTVQATTQAAAAALLDRIGPSILITHSQAGPLGFLITDSRPHLVKSLISLEPQGPPFEDRSLTNSSAISRPWGLTNIPLTYSPSVVNPLTDLSRVARQAARSDLSDCIVQAPRGVKKLVNLVKVPMLVVTTEASFHALYDYCTVLYLQQAGVEKVDYLNLPLFGIRGNAHFMFLEKNNLQIAAKIEGWIRTGRLA